MMAWAVICVGQGTGAPEGAPEAVLAVSKVFAAWSQFVPTGSRCFPHKGPETFAKKHEKTVPVALWVVHTLGGRPHKPMSSENQ